MLYVSFVTEFCQICLEGTEVRRYDELDVCSTCYKRIEEIASKKEQ